MGHVFVARGDITTLACDAWLLPTDSVGTIEQAWSAVANANCDAISACMKSAEWVSDKFVPVGRRPKDVPWVWLGKIGAYDVPAEVFAQAADEFVATVLRHLEEPPRFGRKLPLIGLPLIGTGNAGGARRAGLVAEKVYQALIESCRYAGCDVALLLWTEEAFAGAKHARDKVAAEVGIERLWPELSHDTVKLGDELAAKAAAGSLVLFMGAGASMGAGLPDWKGLIERLSNAAKLTDSEKRLLSGLPEMDGALVIGRRIPSEFLSRVAEEFAASVTSLAQVLLAGLPVRETVTTNYDRLFEMASEGAGCRTAVIPYEVPGSLHQRWLLKLHGCVNHPADIVLTRENYLRYAETRSALAGIVKSLLMTRHMLFIGFSLKDENFHDIVDDVRKLRQSDGGRSVGKFGTALFVTDGDAARMLWGDELNVQQVGDARQLEQFLDYVLWKSSAKSTYLLKPEYADVLSREERELSVLLRPIIAAAEAGQYSSEAWNEARRFLERLGWKSGNR